MTDSSAHPELELALEASVAFYATIEGILGNRHEIGSHRDLLTQGTIATAFEHGVSIVLLVEANQLASATVLLRAHSDGALEYEDEEDEGDGYDDDWT